MSIPRANSNVPLRLFACAGPPFIKPVPASQLAKVFRPLSCTGHQGPAIVWHPCLKPLRILLLTFTYPPNKDGVAEASRSMAEELVQRGHEVVVGTTFLPQRTMPCVLNGVEVRHFDVCRSSKSVHRFHGEVEAFQKFVRDFVGDLIVSHSWDCWPTDLARGEFATKKEKKVLVSHGFSTQIVPWHRKFPWGLGYWLRWQPYVWSLPWMMRAYDHVTFLSGMANFGRFFDHLVARWTGFDRYSIIPNSATVPAEVARGKFRAKYGLEERVVFLCVANYSERKNQELALRAFRGACIKNAALIFIGSEFNDYSKKLQELEVRLSEENRDGIVLTLQGISRAETAEAFQDCDVFVLPAKEETQPIVLLEAMAFAKPFISTDTGCVRELPGGRVVPAEREFRKAMIQLASDAVDRRGLGEAGQAAFRARYTCLLYTSPSPRDRQKSRMPSSA